MVDMAVKRSCTGIFLGVLCCFTVLFLGFSGNECETNDQSDQSLLDIRGTFRMEPYLETNELDQFNKNYTGGLKDKDYRTCRRKTHVAYVKTYKTGSSTLSNMLFRQALRYNNTLLMTQCFGQDYYYALDTEPLFKGMTDKHMKYDLFSTHINHDNLLLFSRMPEDTIYFSSIRDPLSQMKSDFYFRDKSSYLKNPKAYIERYVKQPPNNFEEFSAYFTVNKHYRHPLVTDRYLEMLSERFPFVLVTEYYDESLIIMRRNWCWDLRDILYIPLKVAKKAPLQTPDHLLVEYLKKHKNHVHALYQYYNNTLWRRISEEKRFYQELQYYRTIKEKLFVYAELIKSKLLKMMGHDINSVLNMDPLTIAPSEWNTEFNIKPIDVLLMHMEGSVFRGIFMVKQFKGLCDHTSLLGNRPPTETPVCAPKTYKFPKVFCDKGKKTDHGIPVKLLEQRKTYDLFS